MTAAPSRSQPGTNGMSDNQKLAIRRMTELTRCYGQVFLEKSLHQSRFDYQALKRVAAGLDADCPQLREDWRP